MSGQYRRWVFTLNNYTEEDCEAAKAIACRYIICGKEVGEQGTPHLQGYVEFDGAKRLKGVNALLKAHWERAKGDSDDNEKYCGKDGVWYTKGTPGAPGKRNDLAAVREAFKGGQGIRQMLESDVVATSAALRFAECAAKYLEAARDWETKVIWLWGPSGAGKSRRARELLGTRPYTKSGSNSKWWDGYDAHEDVIIDDFRDSSWPLLDLLAVTDRYEHRVEVKGGMRQLLARRIVITSIDHPREYYRNAPREPIKQVVRRVTQVIHITCPRCDSGVTEVGGNSSETSSA